MRQVMDLTVLAFQSNATRVVTCRLDHGQSNRYFNFIPEVRGTWHALSHYKNTSGQTEDDNAVTSWQTVEQKRAIYGMVRRWHREQVAYLLGRMKAVREPDGSTLLDDSMMVDGSTLGDGNEHDKHDLLTLIIGKGGGTIRTGRQLVFKEPMNLANVHLALLRRTGIEIGRFGTSDRPADELAG